MKQSKNARNYRFALKEVEISKLYFKSLDERIAIINDDFLKVDYIEPNSVDLIVTSPPYNVDF
ncbi:hypothetical protein B6U84_01960 [Candidatus Bathyarchaeota archaeon ex4484_40]|nr:MAG: hypothetical protein B6U84_01960 [Candidatus Bathyarchaeota archaeon ex4484_40]